MYKPQKLQIAFLVLMAPLLLTAAEPKAPQAKEQELIKLLRSDAPPEQKAITCKQLAVYGSEAAVPALAPLLADERLASWALIALEAIPGPAAEEALLKASGKLHGRLLIGVLDSLGVRRDPKAVSVLAGKLREPDPAIASAAAVALGKVGGSKAARALARALPKAPAEVRGAVAEGCIGCAENFLAQGKAAQARRLYDRVRASDVPTERWLEATRGAILARGSAGIPLLLEQLNSPEREKFRLGLRVARELPGLRVTEALIAEFRRTSEARQPRLLLALADRHDLEIPPLLMETVRTGSPSCRLVAIQALDRRAEPASAPALLGAATDGDPKVAEAAMTALARLPGTGVDAMVVERLASASGPNRQMLITLAARRGDAQALPLILNAVTAEEPGVRKAALQALGTLGGKGAVSDLVKLLEQNKNPDDSPAIETALVTLAGRLGADGAQPLLPLVQSGEPALRVVGLHALAAGGGAESLAAIVGATRDQDETVQDEAVRTLCSWPNTWPDDEAVSTPLLDLAKSGAKPSYRVLASRALLQLLKNDRKLSPEAKVARAQELLPLLQRPEEKRSALGLVRELPGRPALQLLEQLAEDPAVAEDACSYIVSVAAKGDSGLSRQERQAALQKALQKCSREQTRRTAESALAKLQ